MALFSLTDITFNKEGSRGPLNDLVDSKFDYNVFRYPEDLGTTYDRGHYLLVHVNEQAKTSFKGSRTTDVPTITANRKALAGQYGSVNLAGNIKNTGSAIQGALKNIPGLSSITDSISKVFGDATSSDNPLVNLAANTTKGVLDTTSAYYNNLTNENFVRTIKRTTDTIALYMPDTMAFDYKQHYSDVSLGDSPLAAAAAAGSSLADALKSGASAEQIGRAVGNLTPFVAGYILNQTNIGKAVFATQGAVVNPMLELLYSSPSFRTFRFEFMMYPRSEKEAAEVQKIIGRLKFHQAPEYVKGSSGYFLVPPSEFDIKFMYNGKENMNIPKVSTCVLTGIDVDYAPNGFAAYEVFGDGKPSLGGTGMPVGIRLALQFKETEILTKSNFSSRGTSEGGVY